MAVAGNHIIQRLVFEIPTSKASILPHRHGSLSIWGLLATWQEVPDASWKLTPFRSIDFPFLLYREESDVTWIVHHRLTRASMSPRAECVMRCWQETENLLHARGTFWAFCLLLFIFAKNVIGKVRTTTTTIAAR